MFYLLMDVIGQVTRPIIQSLHHGHSWHVFACLVWLQGSGTSVVIQMITYLVSYFNLPMVSLWCYVIECINSIQQKEHDLPPNTIPGNE